MKTFFAKYRWPILIGLIAVGVGIFYWLSNFNTPLPAPTAPASTEVTAGDSKPPESTPAVLNSPVSPISPVSSVVITPNLPQTDPEVLQVMIDQALHAQQQGDYNRTVELAAKVLADDPQNFIAYNLRASAFMELGNNDKALADYSKAIELGPLFPHAYYNRGRLLRLQEKYDEAIVDLQKAAELSPIEFGYRANGNIGLIYYAQRNYEQALAAFEKSIAANVENRADVYYYRGETYTAMGNWEAAIQDYEAAIERFANYAEAYRSLGYVYAKNGQFAQAKPALNQALALAMNHPEAHLYLSAVQLAGDQPNEAEVSVQTATAKLDSLAAEQRQLILNRTTDLLKTVAEENPDKAAQAERLIELLPIE